jgi:hypothetical protein
MQLAGARNATFVKGWFKDTVPGREFPEPIAVLRLDGDWYESTLTCLESLYPKVTPGGVVIIDDYYVWDGGARAVHEYLGARQSADRIRPAYEAGCYLVKS